MQPEKEIRHAVIERIIRRSNGTRIWEDRNTGVLSKGGLTLEQIKFNAE